MEIAAKKLIIALDDLDFDSAIKLVELTKPYATTFKVGLSLFSAHGPEIVKAINALGVNVFLDLKLCDIPMQVRKAVESVLALKPRFLTVHASGGRAMLKDAADAAFGSGTTLLAVSVLTSLDQHSFSQIGFASTIAHGVMNLTELAFSAGIHGFVSSPHEISQLKQKFGDACFLVCPGVRPHGGEVNDQSRVMTPSEAIFLGADALVVGRPITKAKNIVEAARAINHEIMNALSQQSEVAISL